MCLALLILISYKFKHWIIIQQTGASRKKKNVSGFTILGLRRVLCVKKRRKPKGSPSPYKTSGVQTCLWTLCWLKETDAKWGRCARDCHWPFLLALGSQSSTWALSSACLSHSHWNSEVFQFHLIFWTKELWVSRAGRGDAKILFSSLACSSPPCCLVGCCSSSWETSLTTAAHSEATLPQQRYRCLLLGMSRTLGHV